MAVLVTMQVEPVNWEKFKTAYEWAYHQKPKGFISSKIYRSESNPKKVLVVEEWESHDAFHKVADKIGDEFNKRAGTAGLEWQDEVWAASGVAVK